MELYLCTYKLIVSNFFSDPVFVYPCAKSHVTCLDCFRQYCSSRLRDRQFWQHPEYGYTLACPVNCADSFIVEIHHFRLLSDSQVQRYLRVKVVLKQTEHIFSTLNIKGLQPKSTFCVPGASSAPSPVAVWEYLSTTLGVQRSLALTVVG